MSRLSSFKHVDFFQPSSQYGVLAHFTYQLKKSFEALGIKCRLFDTKTHSAHDLLNALKQERPDFTVCFNGLLPDSSGHFLADTLKLPHLACLVDSPTRFLALKESTYTLLTCPDRAACQFFKSLDCPAFFMPHAVEKERIQLRPGPKTWPLVLFSSGLDPEEQKLKWQTRFSPSICRSIEEAAELTLRDSSTFFIDALAETLEEETSNAQFILEALERYFTAVDRIELALALKDYPLHIFGSRPDVWQKYLTGTHVQVHGPVPFEEALSIMQNSQLLLNSCPSFKKGGHERIFYGLASGACVISNQNLFTQENFVEKQSIVTYRYGHWQQLRESIDLYLHDENRRLELVFNAQALIAKNHTWDRRAERLIKELSIFKANA